MKSVEKTIEKDFSMFFTDSIPELIKLDKEEANIQKKKKQVVIEVAKRLELEGEAPIDTICMIIIQNLHSLLKPRTIREYLPVKYKLLSKVVNAKKQKSKQLEHTPIDNLAAVPPLDQEGNDKETLLIDTRDDISIEEGIIHPFSPVDISIMNIDLVKSSEHLQSTSQLGAQPPILQQQKETDNATLLTKCPECIRRDSIILDKDSIILDKQEEIFELKEIIKKFNQFTTAQKLVAGKRADDNKEAVEDIIEVECYKIYRETSEYVGSFFHLGNNAKIYFTVRINATTRKLLSFDFGKLDQYRNMDGN